MSGTAVTRVLVAGVGGASLGTEIVKCLRAAGRYDVYGWDVSPLAFGLLQLGPDRSFLVDIESYVRSVLDLCVAHGIRAVIPGGEEPMRLLSRDRELFVRENILPAMNNVDVVECCGDKQRTFERLDSLRIPIPRTISVEDPDQLERLRSFPLPCVIKPATRSGGSHLVCLAETPDEAELYARLLLKNGTRAIAQQYVPHDEGEFTIGVLSSPRGEPIQTVVMERLFHVKLSIASRSSAGLISSGFSQGRIDLFPDVARQAERIAEALGSTGPLNVQARMRRGTLVPFEINPRFSASTYLRTLAGFNEVDTFLRAALLGEHPRPVRIRPGYYLRSLDQTYTPRGVA